MAGGRLTAALLRKLKRVAKDPIDHLWQCDVYKRAVCVADRGHRPRKRSTTHYVSSLLRT